MASPTGAGQDKSILDFAGQLAGAEELLVAAEDVTLEGFMLDTKGDAIKMNQCNYGAGVQTE